MSTLLELLPNLEDVHFWGCSSVVFANLEALGSANADMSGLAIVATLGIKIMDRELGLPQIWQVVPELNCFARFQTLRQLHFRLHYVPFTCGVLASAYSLLPSLEKLSLDVAFSSHQDKFDECLLLKGLPKKTIPGDEATWPALLEGNTTSISNLKSEFYNKYYVK